MSADGNAGFCSLFPKALNIWELSESILRIYKKLWYIRQLIMKLYFTLILALIKTAADKMVVVVYRVTLLVFVSLAGISCLFHLNLEGLKTNTFCYLCLVAFP